MNSIPRLKMFSLERLLSKIFRIKILAIQLPCKVTQEHFSMTCCHVASVGWCKTGQSISQHKLICWGSRSLCRWRVHKFYSSKGKKTQSLVSCVQVVSNLSNQFAVFAWCQTMRCGSAETEGTLTKRRYLSWRYMRLYTPECTYFYMHKHRDVRMWSCTCVLMQMRASWREKYVCSRARREQVLAPTHRFWHQRPYSAGWVYHIRFAFQECDNGADADDADIRDAEFLWPPKAAVSRTISVDISSRHAFITDIFTAEGAFSFRREWVFILNR